MSMNKKAIKTVFSDRKRLEHIFTDAICLTDEELEEDSTPEKMFEVFMTKLSMIANKHVATEIHKYDLDIFYENHNDELTADTLQNEIDSKKRVSKKRVKK
jgi:hypothetical protein